jgi:hypothetical protein
MSAMALGQAVAGMSLLSSSGGKQAGLLDAASGLRRCKADCVRLAAFTVPQRMEQRMEQRLKLGESTLAFFAAVACLCWCLQFAFLCGSEIEDFWGTLFCDMTSGMLKHSSFLAKLDGCAIPYHDC